VSSIFVALFPLHIACRVSSTLGQNHIFSRKGVPSYCTELKLEKNFSVLKRGNTAGKNTTIIRKKEFWFIIYRSSNKSGVRGGNGGSLSESTIMSLSGRNE